MAAASYLSSPDEISPYYPERFIRPLPKRSIRSRLSVEAADSISYPPNPPSASLPAYSHYDYEHEHEHDSYQEDEEHDQDCPNHPHHHHHHHHHCHHHDDDEDDDLDSVDDNSPIAQRHGGVHRSSPRSPKGQRHSRYSSYGGKSSSAADGYEAFENTNNKKKRKIPTSGSMTIHQSSLNSDFGHMGLSSRDNSTEDVSQGYLTSPSGLGVQGAGRGRTGRKSNARNSLGVSTNGSNMRAGPAKHEQNTNVNGDGSRADQGIISKAIANATTILRNPVGKGQENAGVLEQQAKSTPTNSQFTFTCESDAKGVKFPEQSLYSPDYTHRTNPMQASTPTQNQKYGNASAQYAANGIQQGASSQQSSNAHSTSVNNQKPRPRRRKGDVYALAARQRKLQQEYTNLQHPPSHEDIWICEFCEYESIFGTQPHALVRQYEIKDRRERKRLAEKRRLLEKAKLKGRKGKKQSKNASKAASTNNQQPINQQNYDQQPLDQMDDYLDDGYDDDPIPMPAPPPQHSMKPPMPGSYGNGGGGHGGRTASISSDIADGGGGTIGGSIR